ncbi:hypothetical protein J31TS4_42550 [Paenibacillus sp. J31TS4]|uniref:stalk domain-containing protein n=1 Tax=Paenibacillus sp. J31TS4 TaxID=2807195 RepID=UPI001B0B865C|nr:stalk domain-containing protein [Paenibacillus sp. J31TS4]GIP40975.1 hypothetical protein J31TS4_42550 [Paenibacillus sp. J31TS4]
MKQQAKKDGKRRLRKAAGLVLAFALAFQTVSVTTAPNQASAAGTVAYLGQDIITSGAIVKKYQWTGTRSGKSVQVKANVIEVALDNPLVKLDVMTAKGKFTNKQNVKNMATESGAIAGVNGDFFNTQSSGSPMGPQISNGKLMATPDDLPGFYSFALTKDNKPVIDLFTFTGSVTAADGASFNLGGVNKTYYWFEPSGQHSMIDSIFLYTDAWGSEDRANDGVTNPTEVLVKNGVVQEIKQHDIFRQTPPADGYILRSAGKGADWVMAHLKPGDKINSTYAIVPRDPSKSYDTANFKMMIGGHTILVDGGKATSFSRTDADYKGYRARTAIGYSKDQKFAYLINVEDNAGSVGMSFAEMQDLMVQIGVWKGMNLDGGGSSQMVARPLGENQVELVSAPESNYQRPIVNGVGVWTLAPKGEALALDIKGATNLFIGEKASYTAAGYDVYYNPLASLDGPATWSISGGMGTFQDNVLTAAKKGDATITVKSGKATQTKKVHIAGREDIESLTIQPSSSILMDNAAIKLSVRAKMKDGTEKVVPAESFQWETRGFPGTFKGDTLTVGSLAGATSGQIIAKYDGFSTIANLSMGAQKVWADFDKANPATSFSATQGVKGSVAVAPGLQGLAATNQALQLNYELPLTGGTLAAYANFGDGTGVAVEGEPQSISAKVWGDMSLNWLRAELVDAKGAIHRVDFTKAINWNGWQTVSANLSALKPAYPVKLKRIYIADIEEGRDERARKGTVILDDIKFEYKNSGPQTSLNQVKLTINKPQITVNGKTMTIDQAPVLIAGNTLVPIRFVTEALGGEVVPWKEGEERKVTIYKDGQMAEFWLDQLRLNVNGTAITAEVPPQLINERTMVPLRVLTENMGWKVSWDQPTLTVTLE